MDGGMLSQEEINALLGGMDLEAEPETPAIKSELTLDEKDALGEIGNISMGTAATTLFTLLNHKVLITTPRVEVLTWEDFKNLLTDDLVAISVGYTEGLTGMNLMILKEEDVKIIADLMMGGTGAYTEGPISEFHLSAIAEAMNQMIGSSSTSMSQIFHKKIDISPPQAVQMTDDKENLEHLLGTTEDVVKIAFRIQIEENVIDSELMQVLPITFAKALVENLFHQEEVAHNAKAESPASYQESRPSVPYEEEITIQPQYESPNTHVAMQEPVTHAGAPREQMPRRAPEPQNVEVQTPEFQSFDKPAMVYPKENMDVLMDVSLEVSVELGRTTKKIKEILEFGPGSVVELDRLVGEPVNVLVNSKYIAKGEVVVIDENFGIRITDIINPESRI
ncbi:MAG: flagellar motor switch phosphatase FliY [Cellulosilyticaceae bacterium]